MKKKTMLLNYVMLKRNEEHIFKANNNSFKYDSLLQNKMLKKINENYFMNSKVILESCNNKSRIKHEMAIEVEIIDEISNNTNSIFGICDYISHKVVESPFKLIDYIDKMDVFGFTYIKGFKTILKYLLMELTKDEVSIDAVD